MSPRTENLDEELTALRARAKRAIRCGLNKIIESTIDDALQDTIRVDIHILASMARTAETLLAADADAVGRQAVAQRLVTFYASWLADGALNWLGDPAHLDHVHFSSRQH